MWRRLLAVALTLAGALISAAAPARAAGDVVVVDTSADTYDGVCDDGDCSLRDAVASAPPHATVVLPGGFYQLTQVEAGGGPGDGSIEIDSPLRLRGDGETGAFVDGSLLDASVFRIDAAGTVTLRDLTVLGADTEDPGATAWVTATDLRLRHVTVTDGSAVQAGGVFVGADAELWVDRSLFLANRADDGAGAIRTDGGLVRSIVATTFTDNRGEHGGAVWGTVRRFENVTFEGNVARGRGGAFRAAGNGRMRFVTIANNRASRGAAIASGDDVVGARHLVVAGNRSANGPQCAGEFSSGGRNVEDGRGCGFDTATDQPRTDPRLRPLGSYGGPTPTMALRPGSPAIDLGPACGTRDQRGAPRSGPCDAGAYERVLCAGRAVDIVGTRGDDDLSGGREPDTFLGLGGDDFFQGSLADDVACGGRGGDVLWGGPGDDLLRGGPGNDRLDGEGGVDRCVGGPGRDRFRACEDQRINRRRAGGQ